MISDKVLKLLSSVSEKGSANASKALSVMTGQDIAVDISEPELIQIEKLSQDSRNGIVVSVLLKMEGEMEGEILLIFPEDSAMSLVDVLMKKKHGKTVKLDKMDESALKEVGNILAGNYLSSLSTELHLNLLESVPDLVVDTKASVMNSLAVEISQRSFEALVFRMEFEVGKDGIKGEMLMYIAEKSVAKITQ